MMLIAWQLEAQETTGAISGYIKNTDGQAIEFANIKLTDITTNSVSGTVSQANGFYSVPNLTPSYYRLEVSFVGYETVRVENIVITLGKETTKNLTLQSSAIGLGEVTIEASASQDKTGNERSLSAKRIGEVPTIFRSIQELSRSLPESNLNSFGGASHRFNNLNIDGVATNDVIGFQEPASGAAGSQANGTPGSLAKTQPIGLGAIKQLSLKLTPFDVSIGNFNGANIDIITKNGTNQAMHSAFMYGNNQLTFGNRVAGVRQIDANFHDYQLGFNSGGAIKKDKIFYFTNVEFARSSTPLTNAPGSPESDISTEDIDRIRQHLINNYDYSPGAFEQANVDVQSLKIFTRLDVTLNDIHKLTIRNNYVNSFADNLEWNANFFNFGNQGFRHSSRANSTVLELKSSHNVLFNKLNVGFNRVSEGRTFEGRIFPHIQIATSSSSRVFAGTYREASVFNTDFNTFQLTDKLSYVLGQHTLSAGLQLQFNDVDYGFLSAWNGRWEYASVQDFLDDQPSRVRGVYNVNSDNNNFEYVQNNPAGTIGVFEGAAYLQDKMKVSEQLDLTFGLRLDAQFLTQALPVSSLIFDSEHFKEYTNQLNNNFQWNPRLGLRYDIAKTDWTLRGGTGLFSGKLPYLWFGYFEYISGTDYFNIDMRPHESMPLTENLGDLVNIQPGIAEVNLLDPEFRYPRDWKTNIGLDWSHNKWNIGAEFSYTDVLQGLFFRTINRNEVFANFDGADNRIYYNTSGDDVKIDTNFTNIFVLSNTNKGFRYNFTLNGERKTDKLYSYLGYSYGLSKDVSSTVRSSPAANYEWNQALFGNAPDVSFSNYDLRHKIIAIQSLRWQHGRHELLWSAIYNGRSGSPYSFVYQGDLNRDGSSRNDLIYIPADASEIQLVDITDAQGNTLTATEQWQRLDSYISRINYLDGRRGSYAERNGSKTPWNHQLDMKLEWAIALPKAKRVTLSADVFNVFNLVNPNWGALFFVPNVVNSSFSLLQFEGIDNNVPQFSFNIPVEQDPWIVDTFNSRWRIQLGAKVDF